MYLAVAMRTSWPRGRIPDAGVLMRLLGGVQIHMVGMFFEPVLDLLLQMELLGGGPVLHIKELIVFEVF